MVEQYPDQVAPVKHSGMSATATTVGGAAGGAVKGGLKWIGKGTGFFAIVGAAIGLLATIPLGVISAPVVGILWGAGIGGALGLTGSFLTSGIGVLFGGVKGAGRANQRVKMERASAQAMEMQLEAYKYNAMAQAAANQQGTTVYAPTAANYTLPPQGSAMNPAMPQINGMQYDGPVNGQQLLAAR
jgi:hypothetical protein